VASPLNLRFRAGRQSGQASLLLLGVLAAVLAGVLVLGLPVLEDT